MAKKKNGKKFLKKAYKKTKAGVNIVYGGVKSVGRDIKTTYQVTKRDIKQSGKKSHIIKSKKTRKKLKRKVAQLKQSFPDFIY